MHTYIDESGLFLVTEDVTRPAISCCGALTIPSSDHERICSAFLEMTADWPRKNGELKGKILDEKHFDQAFQFFEDNDVIFQAVAIDLSQHGKQHIISHKEMAVQNIRANLPSETILNQGLRLDYLERGISNMPEQLYTQMILMTELIWHTFKVCIAWLSLAKPAELATVHWIVDGKDITPTAMEQVWFDVLLSWLLAKGRREPLQLEPNGDYSYLPSSVTTKQLENGTEGTLDIGHFFSSDSAHLRSSTSDIGLQMADIVTNSLRRALTGNLQYSGWKRLGSIIVQPDYKSSQPIMLVNLGTNQRITPQPTYEKNIHVIKTDFHASMENRIRKLRYQG